MHRLLYFLLLEIYFVSLNRISNQSQLLKCLLGENEKLNEKGWKIKNSKVDGKNV